MEEIFILMAIPGIDMLRLFVFRILKNQSPFKGDRHHLHHYIFAKKNIIQTNLIIQGLICSTFVMMFYLNDLLIILIILSIYLLLIIKFKQSLK